MNSLLIIYPCTSYVFCGLSSNLYPSAIKVNLYIFFLILSFRRVLYVVCFLLGNSPGVWVLKADVSEPSIGSIFKENILLVYFFDNASLNESIQFIDGNLSKMKGHRPICFYLTEVSLFETIFRKTLTNKKNW